MNQPLLRLLFLVALFFQQVLTLAQEEERVAIPLRDPAKALKIRADLTVGGIFVRGEATNELVVTTEVRHRKKQKTDDKKELQPKKKEDTARRLDLLGSGISVHEEDNEIIVSTGLQGRPINLYIYTPIQSSVVLSSSDGEISVEGISGEIEVNNVNGSIRLTNVAGVVIAHSNNGRIKADIRSVTPDKPMSFATLNGNIEVTLPFDTKANLRMETQNGRIQNDFSSLPEKSSDSPADPTSHKALKTVGAKRIEVPINGGGPEFHFKTLNGSILLHQGQK